MSAVLTPVATAVLRRATVQDAPAIAAVRIDSWRATYRGMIPDAYLDDMDLEDSSALWTRVLSVPAGNTTAVFIAEVDGEVLGFAAGMLLKEEKFGLNAELTAIYLKPAAQRAGLGRRLVALVADAYCTHGANGLLVWVIAGNRAARKFYEQLGAELLIEQPFSWDGLDLLEAGYGWRDLPALAAK